jgi:hypothetical protein
MNALKLFKYIVNPTLWLNHYIDPVTMGGLFAGGGALLGGLFGGGGGDDQVSGFRAMPNTLQNFAKVGLRGGYGQPGAGDLYGQGPMEMYPGQMYAGFTPPQWRGIESQKDFATYGMPGLLNQTFGSFGNALNAGNIYNDPSVQRGLDTIENRANRNFAQNTLPYIRQQATGSGNQYSTKGEQAEFSAAYDKDQLISDSQGSFLAQQLASGRGLQGRALGFAPQTMNAGFTPGAQLFAAGSLQQNQNQLGIDEAVNRFNFAQQAPYDNLNNYLNQVGQVSGMGAGNSIVPNNSGINPLAGALGGAQMGYNLASSLWPQNPTPNSATDPYGMISAGQTNNNGLAPYGTYTGGWGNSWT